MKKTLALLLVAILALGLGASAFAETMELTFWTLQGRSDAYDVLTEEFNAAHEGEVHVTISYFDTDGIKDACKVAASSDTLPDMWFNWGGSLGGFYAENGKTKDMTEFAAANGWDEKFSAGALNLCQLGGQLSGYPTSYNVLGVYYNKTIFADLGIEVPTTFEEFEAILPTIKAAGIYPMETGGLNGWHVMRWLELLIEHYAGQELHDQMNQFQVSWDNEAVAQAFTKYKEWVDAGYFPDGFLTADPNDTIMNMGAGYSAMDLEGQWYDGNILQNELDLENYGFFPFPSGETNRMSAFVEQTEFNARLTDEQLAAAVEYMDYLFNEDVAANPDLAKYYNLPLPLIGSEAPAEQLNVNTMLETSNTNGTFTITDQAFPTEVADVLFNCQDAVATGEMDPSEPGALIQAAIDAYLAK